MQKRVIWLVEDEASIADTLIYALQTDGFEVEWFPLGQPLLARLERSRPDFLILDVGLPDISGFELCKQVRALTDTPLMFLTARSEEIEQVDRAGDRGRRLRGQALLAAGGVRQGEGDTAPQPAHNPPTEPIAGTGRGAGPHLLPRSAPDPHPLRIPAAQDPRCRHRAGSTPPAADGSGVERGRESLRSHRRHPTSRPCAPSCGSGTPRPI